MKTGVSPSVHFGIPGLIPAGYQAQPTATSLQPWQIYLPYRSGWHKRTKVHNQNFSATLNVFIRWSFWMLCLKVSRQGLKEFRQHFRPWFEGVPSPKSNRGEYSNTQSQRQETNATTTYCNLPQILNEQGKMRTYFTSSSFLVMTDPTDEKAAEAFCPAWVKVSDVFLYL